MTRLSCQCFHPSSAAWLHIRPIDRTPFERTRLQRSKPHAKGQQGAGVVGTASPDLAPDPPAGNNHAQLVDRGVGPDRTTTSTKMPIAR